MKNNNGTFCTTTLVRKKRGENDVTSGRVTAITSSHVTHVTSGHVTSDHVTSDDVISGSTSFHPFVLMNAENLRRKQQISVAYFFSCTGN